MKAESSFWPQAHRTSAIQERDHLATTCQGAGAVPVLKGRVIWLRNSRSPSRISSPRSIPISKGESPDTSSNCLLWSLPGYWPLWENVRFGPAASPRIRAWGSKDVRRLANLKLPSYMFEYMKTVGLQEPIECIWTYQEYRVQQPIF